MNRIMAFMLLAVAGCGSSENKISQTKHTHVVLMFGQSNAVGGADQTDLPPILREPQMNVPYFYLVQNFKDGREYSSNGWSYVQPRKTKHGAEITLANNLSHDDENWAVIKYAVNGTPVGGRWLPEQNDLYPILIATVRQALVEFNEPAKIEWLLHVAGEGDASRLHAADYYDNVKNIIESLKVDLNIPNVRYVFNQLHNDSDRDPELLKMVRGNQSLLNESYSCAAGHMVNVDDQPLIDQGEPGPKGDIHLSSFAQQALGNRAGKVILKK